MQRSNSTEILNSGSEEFPSRSDIIRCAKQSGYPMDNGLHRFLVKLCETVGWDAVELFKEIFNEK